MLSAFIDIKLHTVRTILPDDCPLIGADFWLISGSRIIVAMWAGLLMQTTERQLQPCASDNALFDETTNKQIPHTPGHI